MPAARETYVASGRVDWLYFIPCAVFALAAALAAGFILHRAAAAQQYALFMGPAFAGLAVGLVVREAAYYGGCRNRWATLLLAAACGACILLGMHYFGMLSKLGFANALRFDLFPGYLHDQLAAKLWRLPGQAGQPAFWASAAVLVGETLTAMVACAFIPAVSTPPPYCEGARRWMQSQAVTLPYGLAKYVSKALASGDLQLLEHVEPLREIGRPPYGQLTFYYGRDEDGRLAGDVILEGAEFGTANDKGRPIDYGNRVIPKWKLTPDEFVALARLFPSIFDLVRPPIPRDTIPAGRRRIAHWRGPGVTLLNDPPAWDVWGVALRVGLLCLPGVIPLAGFVMLGVGIGRNLDALMLAGVAGWVLGVMAWIVIVMRGGLRRWPFVRAKVLTRADRIVDPDADDTFIVELVPRENWTGYPLNDVWDVGFARVDLERGRLLFEGDLSRWELAPDQIESCDIEDVQKVVTGELAHVPRREPFVACLVVRIDDERHELPLRILGRSDNAFRPPPEHSRERAEAFRDRLFEIC